VAGGPEGREGCGEEGAAAKGAKLRSVPRAPRGLRSG